MGKKPKQSVKSSRRLAKPKLVGVRIDLETRSDVDLKKSGVYPYVESERHEILVISYAPIREYKSGARAVGKPRTLDQTSQTEVNTFAKIVLDPAYEKHAFNAQFERVNLSRWVGMDQGTYIDPENWHCAAIKANVNGIFGSLDEVARALRSPIRKDTEGRRLIRLFSSPDKKSGMFHEPPNDLTFPETGVCWCGADHTADFRKFEAYCEQDVLTETGIASLLNDVPAEVQQQYVLDQRINDRGIRHHRKLSKRAVEQVESERVRLMQELKELTGLDNPNSIQQMQGWLEKQGYPMKSLNKESREAALDDPFCPEEVVRALELKGAASLSSVSKHKAALATRCADGRIRGSLQFYGAHTGREAGRGIQPQNLPRYEASAADIKRLLKSKAGQDAPEIAKGSVRASLIPAKGHVFVVFDYNAIEARVLGWLAGERWVMEEFTTGAGKIYEATAATMFGVDKAALIRALSEEFGCGKCGKATCENCRTRGKGKVSNLALGYAGGAGALVTMGAEREGIDIGNYTELHAEWEEAGKPGKFYQWEPERHNYPELIRLRDLFRNASPATVGFWKHNGIAWDRAALTGKTTQYGHNGVVTMMRDGRHNRMVLPSGRSIWYRFAKSHVDPDNPERIDRRTFIGKGSGVGHMRTDTHGGKLTENVTQAVARDVLFDLIEKVEAKTRLGWPGRIVLHVHDEVVLEVPRNKVDQVMSDMEVLMSTPPDWAPGLVVKGEGAVMERYGK